MVKEHRDETPPLFTTESFTPEAADAVIAAFDAKGASFRKRGFDQIAYRTTRFTNASRLMHIPHPMAYARLCKQLQDSWGETSLNRITENPSSKIKPEQHEDGRLFVSDEYETTPTGRVVIMGTDDDVAERRASILASMGKRYFVEADVSSCFPTIYTHALAWSLVGHEEAKRRRNDHAAWFNQIDARQRLLKRNETLGVPVGPATSNIACEIVLWPVDEALRAKYTFTRHIDDYRAFCDSRDHAEQFVRDLEHELSRYLLQLNVKKVFFEELPRPITASWVLEMRNRLPRAGASARDVVDYLDYAIALDRREPDGSILKYACRSISNKLTADSREIFCQYSLNLSSHSPVVLPILGKVGRPGCGMDPSHLSGVLRRHVEYWRSDAVGWAIYLYGKLGLSVSVEDARDIVKSRDCMSMGALLAVRQHQDLVRDFVGTIDASDPYGLDQYWLLLYQLFLSGDLPSADFDDYIEESGFHDLRDANVSFLRFPIVEDEADHSASEEDDDSGPSSADDVSAEF